MSEFKNWIQKTRKKAKQIQESREFRRNAYARKWTSIYILLIGPPALLFSYFGEIFFLVPSFIVTTFFVLFTIVLAVLMADKKAKKKFEEK